MEDTLHRRCALLVLDFQDGAADAPFAQSAVEHASSALKAARESNLLVVFSKIDFMPGYSDVSPQNKTFSEIKAKHLFAPGTGKVVAALQPNAGECVINKDRFSAFCGSPLIELLRANSIQDVVVAGFTTSGVVLSVFCAAIDLDFQVFILSDACADTDEALHDTLLTKLFPRSATVITVQKWIDGLRELNRDAVNSVSR